MKTIKIIGAEFDKKKMHIYDVKTFGKHPVHLVEGGKYITEEEVSEDYYYTGADVGWFWLNQKEYDYFKSQCHQIEINY